MTGMALVSYMLRVVKDVVSRNPRFRRSLGDVSMISGNKISFGDLQVIVRDVTTDAARISFDNFISTTTGRAILTQIRDKDGQFIEWIAETDNTQQTPVAGVYYLNVDSVDEGTRDVGLTMESYKWYEGEIRNAQGTKVVFREGIDGTTVSVTDPTSDNPVLIQPAFGYLYLLSTVGGLLIKDDEGNTLTPMTDYWIEVQSSQVLLQSTIFGTQTATIPAEYLTAALIDQDGFTLRANQDYIYLTGNTVQFSAWTPSGQTITVQGIIQVDPSNPTNLLAAENILPITLLPGESLAPGQVFVSTQEGSHIQLAPNAEGIVVLPAPLPPGGYCNYEVRVLVGQSKLKAKKNAVNKDILPGLRVAIGDQVVQDDQCAIIVSPFITETYRVYGGKPPVSFTLDVKANDPTTADEISKMLMRELLYRRRENLEADGLTLTEAGSSMTQGSRDDSGTAPTYSVAFSYSGLADWRVFEPLVTRITSFTVTAQPYIGTFQGDLVPSDRFHCLSATGFIPDYR